MVVVAYSELPTTGMPKVFTTAVFSQFLALHPRHINDLANKKLENGPNHGRIGEDRLAAEAFLVAGRSAPKRAFV
jgi:hypothetical protein